MPACAGASSSKANRQVRRGRVRAEVGKRGCRAGIGLRLRYRPLVDARHGCFFGRIRKVGKRFRDGSHHSGLLGRSHGFMNRARGLRDRWRARGGGDPGSDGAEQHHGENDAGKHEWVSRAGEGDEMR